MPDAIRIGLVGYGYWGPNYARVLSELPGCAVTAVCEPDLGRLKKAIARLPGAFPCVSLVELLTRTEVDAVVVSTPATSHFELTQAALEAERHVLVEKPLALTVEHCDTLIELAERRRMVLMVAHTFLYNSGIRKMKECMYQQDFGRIYYLHSTRTNLGPIRRDVNALWDLAPHDVSIFNYLLDQQPLWASAVGAGVLGSSREDVSFINLCYSGGVIGNIHVSWADPNKVREVVAVGSRRRVVFNDLNDLERVRIFEKGVSAGEMATESFGEFKLLVRDGDIISPHIDPSEPLKNQCLDFLESIRSQRAPFSDATVGLQVVRALVAASQSLRESGVPKEIQHAAVRPC
jgi:predicted dehydrogenase